MIPGGRPTWVKGIEERASRTGVIPKHRGKPGRPKGPLGFPNANPHRDKHTQLLVNMSPCPACVPQLKKRGQHRLHKRCLGQTVGQSVVTMCDCECRRMSTTFLRYIEEHSMAFDKPA